MSERKRVELYKALDRCDGQILDYVNNLEAENAQLRQTIEKLREALGRLIGDAESYMTYHKEKFYPDGGMVVGLYPAIESAKFALAEAEVGGGK